MIWSVYASGRHCSAVLPSVAVDWVAHLCRVRVSPGFNCRPADPSNDFFRGYKSCSPLVRLLGRGIGPSRGLSFHRTTQTPPAYIYAPSGVRTHDPTFLGVEDCTRPRPRGHCEGESIVFYMIS